MRKPVLKVGDSVRIIVPILVKRVGYPLVFTDLIKEFEDDPRIDQAMKLLGLNPNARFSKRDFLQGVTKSAVRSRNWGGSQRTIHHIEAKYLHGQVVEITGKRTAKTGTYYPPSGGYNSWSDEYDYEPGGLSDMKSHILLDFYGGTIESCNVIPVGNNARSWQPFEIEEQMEIYYGGRSTEWISSR
jgi:hypothetical protein